MIRLLARLSDSAPAVIGLIIAAVGALSLGYRIVDETPITALASAPMAVSTALCFVLLGGSLVLLARGRTYIACALGLLSSLLSAATLLRLAAGPHWQDTLFGALLPVDPRAAPAMSGGTALGFVLLSFYPIYLALVRWKPGREAAIRAVAILWLVAAAALFVRGAWLDVSLGAGAGAVRLSYLTALMQALAAIAIFIATMGVQGGVLTPAVTGFFAALIVFVGQMVALSSLLVSMNLMQREELERNGRSYEEHLRDNVETLFGEARSAVGVAATLDEAPAPFVGAVLKRHRYVNRMAIVIGGETLYEMTQAAASGAVRDQRLRDWATEDPAETRQLAWSLGEAPGGGQELLVSMFEPAAGTEDQVRLIAQIDIDRLISSEAALVSSSVDVNWYFVDETPPTDGDVRSRRIQVTVPFASLPSLALTFSLEPRYTWGSLENFNVTMSISLLVICSAVGCAVGFGHSSWLKRQEIQVAHQSLADANRRLQQANSSRDAFLAMMSHELRTPLHVVLAGVEVLELELEGLEQRRALELTSMVERSANHLLNLISDILEYSRLQSEASAPRLAMIEPLETVGEALAATRLLAEQRGIDMSLSVDGPQADLSAYLDGRRFYQILLNLLANAIKYSEEGAVVSIELAAREAEMTLEVRVRNRGRAIPPDMRRQIFYPFVQASDKESKAMGGTGLGLAIVRHLVASHNGRLGLCSGESEGTTFQVTLPWHRSPVASERFGLVDAPARTALLGAKRFRAVIIDHQRERAAALATLLREMRARDVYLHDPALGPLVPEAADHRTIFFVADEAYPAFIRQEGVKHGGGIGATRKLVVLSTFEDTEEPHAETPGWRTLGVLRTPYTPTECARLADLLKNA